MDHLIDDLVQLEQLDLIRFIESADGIRVDLTEHGDDLVQLRLHQVADGVWHAGSIPRCRRRRHGWLP